MRIDHIQDSLLKERGRYAGLSGRFSDHSGHPRGSLAQDLVPPRGKIVELPLPTRSESSQVFIDGAEQLFNFCATPAFPLKPGFQRYLQGIAQ